MSDNHCFIWTWTKKGVAVDPQNWLQYQTIQMGWVEDFDPIPYCFSPSWNSKKPDCMCNCTNLAMSMAEDVAVET